MFVGRADDFLRRVVEHDTEPQNGGVDPLPGFRQYPGNTAAHAALRTTASVLEWLDVEVKLLAVIGELEPRDFQFR